MLSIMSFAKKNCYPEKNASVIAVQKYRPCVKARVFATITKYETSSATKNRANWPQEDLGSRIRYSAS